MHASRPTLVLAISAGLAAAGCASSAPSPLQDRSPQTSTVSLETQSARNELTLRRDDFVAVNALAAPVTATWRELLEVWEEVGLPEPQVDRRAFTLSVANAPVHRRLGRERLSSYLNCGNSMSGMNADTHRIRLTVSALVDAAGADSSRLHVRVDAMAHSMEGASTAPVQCTSRGALESLVTRRVRERLAAGG
jgi:hypothetical protein